MLSATRAAIFSQLQSDILRLQHFCPSPAPESSSALGFMLDAFPNKSFPVGAVHEFLSDNHEDAAATSGFVGGLLSSLMQRQGTGLWISSSRTLFPPALTSLGLRPEQFIFVDLQHERDVLWTMNEALKCAALTVVVGEIRDIDFTQTRRLQLAVEQSLCTGFILRHSVHRPGVTACVSRWKVSSLPSVLPDGLPGIGYPGWRVELMKIRNGKPGAWDIHWKNGVFVLADSVPESPTVQQQKTG